MFQAGRYFAGQGIGILVTIVPMFISEMAHPTKRGWLVGHHAIFLVFGYMLSSWVGFGCYCKKPQGHPPSNSNTFPLMREICAAFRDLCLTRGAHINTSTVLEYQMSSSLWRGHAFPPLTQSISCHLGERIIRMALPAMSTSTIPSSATGRLTHAARIRQMAPVKRSR